MKEDRKVKWEWKIVINWHEIITSSTKFRIKKVSMTKCKNLYNAIIVTENNIIKHVI